MMKKEAEWTMEERWNGRKEVEHHTSGPWTIVIDPDTRDGFIRSRHQKTIVESLEPNRFLEKGTGIPNYVIDKVNEVIAVPQPIVEGEGDRMEGIRGSEHLGFAQTLSNPIEPGALIRFGKKESK